MSEEATRRTAYAGLVDALLGLQPSTATAGFDTRLAELVANGDLDPELARELRWSQREISRELADFLTAALPSALVAMEAATDGADAATAAAAGSWAAATAATTEPAPAPANARPRSTSTSTTVVVDLRPASGPNPGPVGQAQPPGRRSSDTPDPARTPIHADPRLASPSRGLLVASPTLTRPPGVGGPGAVLATQPVAFEHRAFTPPH